MKKRTAKLLGAALLFALSITACAKEADGGAPDATQGAPVSGGDSGTEKGTAADGENASGGAGMSSQDEGEKKQKPQISFTVLSVSKEDGEGNELVRAQYPVFAVSGEGYEALAAALASWNEEWKAQADAFLGDMGETAAQYRESVDASGLFQQDISVNVMRCDEKVVSVLVARSVEEGGAHPNNYYDARNFNAGTGAVLKFSDVVEVDDALKGKIKMALSENYPELEFDEALLDAEIPAALADETLEWYYMEEQVCINFKEGSFGFGHAEGSLGVVLAVGE